MATVELCGLTKHYGTVGAVASLDLSIADRELMVLVGPSGCGKSTALRMIAGLEEPTAGDILIDGRRVNALPPKDRDVAMVFQNYALYPHMTVFQNMAFGLKLRRVPKKEIAERVEEAAGILDLHEVLERKPAQLSGGQRQRVAVGRAIVRKPKVFLFDEPLSNLDAKLRNQTRAELVRLHRRLRATMIYVTHDQIEAMTMGDRIAALAGGRLQQVDRPMSLYAEPRNLFVAGFIGSPAMNLWAGSVAGGVFEAPEIRFPLERIGKPALADGQRITLGLRPEHLGLVTGNDNRIRLRGAVELLEPLGAETYAHVRTGEKLVTARLAPTTHLEPGAVIELGFDPTAGHLFDTDTGGRIGGD